MQQAEPLISKPAPVSTSMLLSVPVSVSVSVGVAFSSKVQLEANSKVVGKVPIITVITSSKTATCGASQLEANNRGMPDWLTHFSAALGETE